MFDKNHFSLYLKIKMAIKKKVLQYAAIFEPAEEGGYTVTIPALPGCLSEGDTFEKAMSNIEEAAELYVGVMLKHKEKPEYSTARYPVIAPISVAV